MIALESAVFICQVARFLTQYWGKFSNGLKQLSLTEIKATTNLWIHFLHCNYNFFGNFYLLLECVQKPGDIPNFGMTFNLHNSAETAFVRVVTPRIFIELMFMRSNLLQWLSENLCSSAPYKGLVCEFKFSRKPFPENKMVQGCKCCFLNSYSFESARRLPPVYQ